MKRLPLIAAPPRSPSPLANPDNQKKTMKPFHCIPLLRLCAAPIVLLALSASPANADNWQLVWSDEFHGSISPDWNFETGNNNGWGNGELEYYTSANATVQNDNLVITAKKEDMGGFHYTSARMTTQNTRAFQYGRMEARIKLPAVQGLWPAFWMLGSDITQVGWPASGELDIMEQIDTGNTVYGTAHWQAANGTHASYGLSLNTTVSDWHVYAIEWTPTTLTWYVDGTQYCVMNIANGVGNTYAFQNSFFLLLNMAVGGNWPGYAIDDASLPAQMLVDYVRVYAPASASATSAWTPFDKSGYVMDSQNGLGRIDPVSSLPSPQSANWVMVPGLAGGGVSFQSAGAPGNYLRQSKGKVYVQPYDGTAQFQQDATFRQDPGLALSSDVSFESWAAPGNYLRHGTGTSFSQLFVTPVGAQLAKAATWLPTPPLASSILIQAEDYALMSGVQTETCSEGGLDVGWIDAGDWMVYNVNLPVSGTYTVSYRVASLSGGGTLQLEKAGGTPTYGQLAVPSTGGWQNWTTISHQVQLPAGQQQIAIKALGGGWNINWFQISQ